MWYKHESKVFALIALSAIIVGVFGSEAKDLSAIDPKAFYQPVDMKGYKIQNLGAPSTSTDAASKGYVDNKTWDVSHGGTGVTSFTGNSLLASGVQTTDPLTTIGIGTSGYFLQSQGGGGYPSWVSVRQPNVQEFTADGTWSKPSGCVWYLAELVGPGGPGGGGARGSTNGGGGGGGGGGARVLIAGPLSELASSVSVTVGQSGSVGTGATTANTGGGSGGVGTATTWHLFKAVAGLTGSGGTTSSGGAGANAISNASGHFMALGGVQAVGGASGGLAGVGSAGATTTTIVPTGGGGGGGASSSNQSDGGSGGGVSGNAYITTTTGGLGGSKGVRSPATGNTYGGCGFGGGGGCGSNTGSAGQAGATGGFPGGGGGGGGGGYNTQNGGNGGLGGGGFVRVTCW